MPLCMILRQKVSFNFKEAERGKVSIMDGENVSGGDGGGRMRVPGFLSKTYAIVDDPSTDSVVSWGEFGDSLIIWDHLKFSEELLPLYFRHSNLSSFVYQLNNYGFRKIGCEHQWEYRNKDFQRGKMHLLSNMKRRSQKRSHYQIMMEKGMNEIKLEIKKLKRKQTEMENDISALEKEVKDAESKGKEMMAFWDKAWKEIIDGWK